MHSERIAPLFSGKKVPVQQSAIHGRPIPFRQPVESGRVQEPPPEQEIVKRRRGNGKDESAPGSQHTRDFGENLVEWLHVLEGGVRENDVERCVGLGDVGGWRMLHLRIHATPSSQLNIVLVDFEPRPAHRRVRQDE